MESFGSLKYSSSWKFHDVLETILPLKSPPAQRQKPMQILALGLNRCGTDSLRVALEELGYTRCYHGYVCQMDSRPDPLMWSRLMAHKFSQSPEAGRVLPEPIPVDRAYFDRILWDCTAVTDAPAAIFGPELIRAYPDAKVILNCRDDIDAWDRSMKKSVVSHARNIGWLLHLLSWFDAESFWVTRVHLWMSYDYYKCDFDRYGKAVYTEHFARIREMLEPHQYLEWTVQDGWEPLCAFLDNTPVPDHDFPDGNKQQDWQAKVQWNSVRMLRRASRNFLLTVAASVAAFAAYKRYRK